MDWEMSVVGKRGSEVITSCRRHGIATQPTSQNAVPGTFSSSRRTACGEIPRVQLGRVRVQKRHGTISPRIDSINRRFLCGVVPGCQTFLGKSHQVWIKLLSRTFSNCFLGRQLE
jgi:hypothetical protein